MSSALTAKSIHRALNREQHSLYNCLLSVLDDTRFVDEIRALYPTLPVFVNLRCGLWYSESQHQTCYFKSTDGHFGNWNFSCVRLNLQVAKACSDHGGCIIIDATRRGKTFPDSFTKTVPIWAAVLNRAARDARSLSENKVSRATCNGTCQREHSDGTTGDMSDVRAPNTCPEQPVLSDNDSSAQAQPAKHLCSATAYSESTSNGNIAEDWDCTAHFPLWITQTERALVSPLLPNWTEQFISTCRGNIPQYLRDLSKPLRPLWISQSSLIWTNHIPEPGSLPFTPIYLVSASLPLLYHRRVTSIPRVVPTLSEPSDPEDAAPDTISYVYIPGAGDDEESWAQGLEPATFWQHISEILGPGPLGIADRVKSLQNVAKTSLSSCTNREYRFPIQGPSKATPMVDPNEPRSEVDLSHVHQISVPVATDAHHLRPSGCAAPDSAQASEVARGVFRVGTSGLVLAGAADVHAWLATARSPPSTPTAPTPPPALDSPATPETCAAAPHLPDCGGVGAAPPSRRAARVGAALRCCGICAVVDLRALRQGAGSVGEADALWGCGPLASSGAAGADREEESARAGGAEGSTAGAHVLDAGGVPVLRMPVLSSKRDRTSLLRALGPVLRFIAEHTSDALCDRGRCGDTRCTEDLFTDVPAHAEGGSGELEARRRRSATAPDPFERQRHALVVDDDGVDVCVCVAVAALMAAAASPGSPPAHAATETMPGPGRTGASAPATPSGGPAPGLVTKEAMRQQLAYVSAWHPSARPTRGNLRQAVMHVRSLFGGADAGAAAVLEATPAASAPRGPMMSSIRGQQ